MNEKKSVKSDNKSAKPLSNRGKYIEGVGRRKRAIARIRLFRNGHGKVTLNKKEINTPDTIWLEPLAATNLLNRFDLSIQTTGGGISSQAEAVRMALARALVKYDKTVKKTLRVLGYLTRDPREKERKKPGLKRARRAPQWQKR